MSDVIVVMRDGRIQQQGRPAELYERPVNRFVAGFIGTLELPAGDQSRSSTPRHGTATVRDGRRAAHPRPGHRSGLPRPGQGDAVTVAIRPERLRGRRRPTGRSPNARRLDTGAGADPPGHLPRRQTEYRVETELAGELVVRRQNVRADADQSGIRPGRAGDASRWHDEANLVLGT